MATRPDKHHLYPERHPALSEEVKDCTLDPYRLLFVGRLVEAKGVDVLLDACVRLRDEGVPFHLDIVGDGPERGMLEERARDSRLADRVTFHGMQNDPGRFFQNRSVVVQPSRWEGLPLVTLEAMRARCPIVASRVGGIPQVLSNGESALLVDPAASAALARALGRLLGNTSLAESLSNRAYQRFASEFESSRTCQAHIDLYARLLRGAGTDAL
jgi:glycosyltransferase involved in cell wall biosynthesis